jgi:hypothetical protein
MSALGPQTDMPLKRIREFVRQKVPGFKAAVLSFLSSAQYQRRLRGSYLPALTTRPAHDAASG